MIKIGKNILSFSTYSCQPKTREELERIINERIKQYGPNCDLNNVDVALIDDMSELFIDTQFNGDISKWNTSNVTNMREMFAYSKFNQDISRWKLNKECNTSYMFTDCPIKKEYKPKLPR